MFLSCKVEVNLKFFGLVRKGHNLNNCFIDPLYDATTVEANIKESFDWIVMQRTHCGSHFVIILATYQRSDFDFGRKYSSFGALT